MRNNELLLLQEELERRARDMGVRSFGIADLTPARDAIVAQGGEFLAGFERALSVGIALGNGVVDQLPRHKEVTVARTYDQLYSTVNQSLNRLALLWNVCSGVPLWPTVKLSCVLKGKTPGPGFGN